MSNFTPDKGTLFYTQFKTFTIDEPTLGGTVVSRVVRDNSYSSEVLKCIGRDERMIVAERVSSSWSKGPLMLPRHQWQFFPVGPEVMAALGLDGASEEA